MGVFELELLLDVVVLVGAKGTLRPIVLSTLIAIKLVVAKILHNCYFVANHFVF